MVLCACCDLFIHHVIVFLDSHQHFMSFENQIRTRSKPQDATEEEEEKEIWKKMCCNWLIVLKHFHHIPPSGFLYAHVTSSVQRRSPYSTRGASLTAAQPLTQSSCTFCLFNWQTYPTPHPAAILFCLRGDVVHCGGGGGEGGHSNWKY